MATLLDQWGRAHPVAAAWTVGRRPSTSGLVIAEPSVSRHHADVERSAAGWVVVDRESSNGTCVNGQRVPSSAKLAAGDVVSFGHVSFFFLGQALSGGAGGIEERATHRPAPPPLPRPNGDDDEPGEETFAGLGAADVRLAEPKGGGGGVLEIDGRAVHLTATQFELMRVLVSRMTSEPGFDPRVRGFVRSSELAACLPWDTARPDDNNIKQLVRRLRRALMRAGIADVVESRHGFGYRLRVVPRET